METSELIEKIRNKYPDTYSVDALNAVLQKMCPLIKNALITFLDSGNLEEIVLLGYSIDTLVERHGMNEFAAYGTLDWIIREPERAIASLKKGHEVIKW